MKKNDKAIELLKNMGLGPIAIVDADKYIKPEGYKEMEGYYSKAMEEFTALRSGSIIVMCIPYKHEKKSRLMSMGSLSTDYHRVFEGLAEDIKNAGALGNFKAFTDTGPLFDRSAALISGLGFKGKNEFVINKTCGTYFYIAYLLTEEKFEEYSEPINYDCGACDLCMRACPTGAINEGRFKAELCLSHLTQAVGIDEKFFPYIKTLYGCDICQRVCPYNKDTPPGLSVFEVDEDIDYEKLFAISNSDYKKIFGDKAFFWRKRNIIKRNAILRAANLGQNIDDYIKMEEAKGNKYLFPAIEYYKNINK